MSFRNLLVCAALAAALPVLPAHAQAPAAQGKATKPADQAKAPTLAIGDAAPALAVAKWVKGAPVERFEKGKVYLVEFWATWCGPCIASMPHLTELQKKYKDQGLTIVAVSSADSHGNTLEKVEAMVKDKADGMGYAVAWDDERKTNEAFMKAAGQGGIPCSFLVDGNGKIAYIGHPMRIDATLELVVSGKHDIQALTAAAKKAKENEAKARDIQMNLNKAAGAKDWESAVKACDDLLALDADTYDGAAAAKFQILATELKDLDRAYAWAKTALEGACKDSENALNAMAWLIVDPETELARRDADLAVKLAQRAAELTQEKNAAVLDTLARAWFTKGDAKKAVEVQRKAVALDAKLKPALDEYEKALGKSN
jgi:thiol-disulfide isomerase/thioredoxin